MGYIAEGFVTALRLLIRADPETYSAVFTTLRVSSLSIMAALAVGIPLGFLLGYYEFRGKRQIRAVVDTLLALPTVVVGLFVYALISKRGPLGNLGLLFTIPGIGLAQTILILPIVIALTATAISNLDVRFRRTVLTLGAGRRRTALTALYESRYGVIAAAVAAYGRAIGEVGISMMIGGNIKWHTRTITTAIALETGKGQFAMGIALGIVLLILAFVINWILQIMKRRV
ncbi:MAG: ABC transporter permease [Spirochaetota bacterium]|nr:MAG: ABC transporter permease [Spirochaetota bacterium]